EHRSGEDHHFPETERPELSEHDRPRVQEDDLYVEDDEDHRHEVEAHREALGGLAVGHDAALVWSDLGGRWLLRRQHPRREERQPGEERRQYEHQEQRQVLGHQLSASARARMISLSRSCSTHANRLKSSSEDTITTAGGFRIEP